MSAELMFGHINIQDIRVRQSAMDTFYKLVVRFDLWFDLIELRVRHLPFSYAVGEGPTSEFAISPTSLLAGEPLPSARKMNGKHIDNIKRPRMHMIGNSWEHALYSDARIELNESCSHFQAFAAQPSTIFTTKKLSTANTREENSKYCF